MRRRPQPSTTETVPPPFSTKLVIASFNLAMSSSAVSGCAMYITSYTLLFANFFSSFWLSSFVQTDKARRAVLSDDGGGMPDEFYLHSSFTLLPSSIN
jgi:heme/copper-type cytochrome/quinol oxidase subunit 3